MWGWRIPARLHQSAGWPLRLSGRGDECGLVTAPPVAGCDTQAHTLEELQYVTFRSAHGLGTYLSATPRRRGQRREARTGSRGGFPNPSRSSCSARAWSPAGVAEAARISTNSHSQSCSGGPSSRWPSSCTAQRPSHHALAATWRRYGRSGAADPSVARPTSGRRRRFRCRPRGTSPDARDAVMRESPDRNGGLRARHFEVHSWPLAATATACMLNGADVAAEWRETLSVLGTPA